MPWTCSYRDVTEDPFEWTLWDSFPLWDQQGSQRRDTEHVDDGQVVVRLLQFLSGPLDCWNQTSLRCTVNFGQSTSGAGCSFPWSTCLSKVYRTILQKDALTLTFSLWRVFQPEDLELWIYFLKGREKGRMLPCCLKATIRAAFGCLTVNYGHI